MDIFAIFKFYFYLITLNKKRYKVANENKIEIILFPLALMILPIIFIIPFNSKLGLILQLSLLAFVLINTSIAMLVDFKGWEKENERIREEIERDRLKREAERRAREYFERQERQHRERAMWEEILREHYRRQEKERQQRIWEEEQRQRRERIRREYDDLFRKYGFNRDGGQQQQQSSNNNNQSQYIDQNRINAMKLMGLKEGFTAQDLKKRYRELSKVHHPDLGGLEVNFIKLNKAYNYLLERM